MFRADSMVGPYTLVRELGRGAFGMVWLAERRTSFATTQVALKLPLAAEPDVAAIRQEARMWVQASGHPNVLPVIEAEMYDGQIAIVSEYASGGSLAAWKSRPGRRTIGESVTMVRGILAGLAHLHERRIIHRDLKPANILLQGATPRLTDFGLARVIQSATHSNVMAGTPSYMAPEAWNGERSEQTDLWSAGVILYELLTGRLPFPQVDLMPLFLAISREEPPLPADVHPALARVLRMALMKSAADRFKSVREMLEALPRDLDTLVTDTLVVPGPDQAPAMPTQPIGPGGVDVAAAIAEAMGAVEVAQGSSYGQPYFNDTNSRRVFGSLKRTLDGVPLRALAEALVPSLANADAKTRWKALRFLGYLRYDDAATLRRFWEKEPEGPIRELLIDSLEGLAEQEQFDLLADIAVNDDRDMVRFKAVNVLGEAWMARSRDAVVRVLLASLDNDGQASKTSALNHLRQAKVQGAVPVARNQLARDKDNSVRVAAAQLLAALGPLESLRELALAFAGGRINDYTFQSSAKTLIDRFERPEVDAEVARIADDGARALVETQLKTPG